MSFSDGADFCGRHATMPGPGWQAGPGIGRGGHGRR
jgi:hypothetical protein